MSKTQEERKQAILKNVIDNYKQIEKSMVEQLYMRHDLHGTTAGTAREDIWRQIFEMVVPKKFVIEQSAFIIDSKDGVSHEVDLVLLDETYTPYIFRYGKLKFIPIEAVAAVVECKSKKLTKSTILDWCESIENLRTADDSIVRMATAVYTSPAATQKSTRPIRILCAVSDSVDEEIRNCFDFTLRATKKDTTQKDRSYSKIEIEVNPSLLNLYDWYNELNFYKYDKALLRDKEPETLAKAQKELEKITLESYAVNDQNHMPISLLTFNFQLNQLLMLINNPMLFPHRAYAEMFSIKKGDES